MHRGAEKLFEVRDYRQIIVLANRHDWLSAFSNELGVVLAVERMLGMEVPERAVWARTLLAELNRVLNHLMFLGSYPLELGAITPIFYSFREREELQAVMEEVSGGRMHYMFNRVGGLKEDLPAGWLGRVEHAVAEVRRRMTICDNLVVGNEIFLARTRGVGILQPETVPRTASAGHRAGQRRRRRPAPRRALPRVRASCSPRAAPAGSSPAPRATAWPGFEVLLEQTEVCLDLADACLDRLRTLPPGPINVRLPKVLRGARGPHLHRDREPAGLQRLLPGVAR